MAKGKIIDIQTGEIKTVEDKTIKVTPRTLETSLNNSLECVPNIILAQSDWMANSDVTMSDEWKTYRKFQSTSYNGITTWHIKSIMDSYVKLVEIKNY